MIIATVALAWAVGSAASPAPPPASPARAAASPRPTPPPPVAEGSVSGPDGKPVAGAAVIVSLEHAELPQPPLTTKTDAAGQFRLALRSASPFTLRVETPGLAAATLRHLRAGTPVKVTLSRGGAIEGVIRDSAGGAPVPGATVEGRAFVPSATFELNPDVGVVRATTDAKGHYRLDGLAAGLYTVSAFARGLGRADRSNLAPGRAADLLLVPGGAVAGTVTVTGGKPVAGAVVRLVDDRPFQRARASLQARSDPAGAFAIYGVPAGSYRLLARQAELAPAVTPSVAVDRDGETRADVVMSPPAEVRGRLIGGDKGARGQVVLIEAEGMTADDLSLTDVAAEAGDDGAFVLKLGQGSYLVEARARGFGPRRLDVDVSPRGETVDLGDVVLERGITIRGRVRGPDTRPLEGADVSTWSPESGQEFSARTDQSGDYVLAGLSRGMHSVSARAPGMGRAERRAEAGAAGVDFALQPAGRITGLVLDDAGRPVPAFRVNARSTARGGFVGGGGQPVGADDGHFTLEDIAEGTYVVDVTAPDRAPGVVPSVKVAAASTVDVGTVRLRAGGVVRGIVVDTASAPVAGATVVVTGPGRDSMRAAIDVTTDAGGAFEYRGVPAGTAQVQVTHPSFSPGLVTGVDVDPARGPAEVKLVLSQGGRIEGVVRTLSGGLPPGAAISARPIRAGGSSLYPGGDMVPVSGDATFAIDHVPAGRVEVTLMAGQAGQYNSVAGITTEVREGETTAVEVRLRQIGVTGHVTRAGAPLAEARVEFNSRNAGVYMSGSGANGEATPPNVGVTGEDGTYRLTTGEPGEHWVDIQTPDRKGYLGTRPVQVPDADSYVADFDYSGAFIEGVVVEKDTDQPVAGAFVNAARKDPRKDAVPGGGAEADGDGRFHVEVDPGEYVVTARQQGFGGDAVNATVGESGTTGLRLVLVRGLSIKGRVVDVAGRGMAGVVVRIRSIDPAYRFGGGARTMADGSFEASGLRDGQYALSAVAEGGLFAIALGAKPGGPPARLTLRPGGRVRVSVRGPDGTAAAGVSVSIAEYQGTSIGLGSGQTDSTGTLDLPAPLGTIELTAASADDTLSGKTTVAVQESAVATAEITLAPLASP